MPEQRIEDEQGREIVVGTKVMYGAPDPGDEARHRATVIDVGEYDIDYDDDLGRPRLFPPRVKIRFSYLEVGDQETVEVSTEEVPARLTWADYPDGPAVYVFCPEDLTVIDDELHANVR